MKYKKISLTQSKVALVNVKDYEYLNQFKWYALKNHNAYYATRNIYFSNGTRTIIRMHQEIMKTSKGMDTDHINGNSLDNRKCNLRICNHAQNGMNRKINYNNTSDYKGVSFYYKKWMAYIRVNGKRIHLGCFLTKEEAALVYNEAAKKYHGEFARLNIIGG